MANENTGMYAWTAGAGLKYSTTGIPGSFTEIGDIIALDSPEMQTGEIPSSSLRTPEYIKYTRPGWITPGEVTLRITQTATQFASLWSLYRQRKVLWWYVLLPNDEANVTMGTEYFIGWIKSFKPTQSMERDQDANVEGELRIKVSRLGKVSTGGDAARFYAAGSGTL